MDPSPPTWNRPLQQRIDSTLHLLSSSNFHIVKRIGEGWYGTVYHLILLPTAIHYALKVVYVFQDIIRNQLSSEIHFLCSLDPHPNIVQCYSLAQFGSEFHILFEYIDGISLKECKYHIPHKQESFLAHIARQILRGLAHLNGWGIAHLDIKPSNVLIMLSKQLVTISDFVSRILSLSVHSSEMSVETFAYSAPERINFFLGNFSNLNVNDNYFASDIWSLGVIILELYLGYFPIQGDLAGMVYAICESPPPEVPIEASLEFRYFISCCLKKETNLRSTASQLLDHPFIKRQRLLPLLEPLSSSIYHL